MVDPADVELRLGGARYAWTDGWGAAAGPTSAWPHHGIATLTSGEIVCSHPDGSRLIYFNADGSIGRLLDVPVVEAHGITVSNHDGEQHLWLADGAMRRDPLHDYQLMDQNHSRVVEVGALSGVELRRLPRPRGRHADAPYRPTCAVEFEVNRGGNGDVWVADGYGDSLVHRFNAGGDHLATLSGEEREPAGRFECPHALFIDRRRGEPELMVADRAMGRIQVFNMEGLYRRTIGEEFLSRPTWIIGVEELLIVVEYRPPRLTVLDADDRLIGYLGADPSAAERPGWPNCLDDAGAITRPTTPMPGRFNSPHAAAADRDGTLYVTEWFIGGRIIRLRRL